MFTWLLSHNEVYGLDLENLFAVGDSAGAQLLTHYVAILKNPEFQKLFSFTVPKNLHFRALGLNCGMYDPLGMFEHAKDKSTLLIGNTYLGKDRLEKDPKVKDQTNVLSYITKDYPPCFILTGQYDFLKEQSLMFHQFLDKLGVENTYKHYGKEGEKEYQHVFHLNIALPGAKEANQDELNFFRSHLIKKQGFIEENEVKVVKED